MCKQEITIVNYDFRGPNEIRTYVVPRTAPAPLHIQLGPQQFGDLVAGVAPGVIRDNLPHEAYDHSLEKRK